MLPRPPGSTLFPCTTLFRSGKSLAKACSGMNKCPQKLINVRYQSNGGSPLDAPELREAVAATEARLADTGRVLLDRKSTRLNSSHVRISYAVFCLKKKTRTI